MEEQFRRRIACTAITAVLLTASLVLVMGATREVEGGENLFGTLDAWIAGKVRNATTQITVSCETMRREAQPPDTQLFFNATADLSGNFNITVDSDTWGTPPQDLKLQPYRVGILPNYYQGPAQDKDLYVCPTHIYPGNTTHVPAGSLEVITYPTSNLTIQVLNKTSGEPLPGARVELEYPLDFPTAPFPLTQATDPEGNVTYQNVRSVNTTVKVTKLNFKPLSDTEVHDYVIVQEGWDTFITFRLTEKDWPFRLVTTGNDVNITKNITVDFGRVMDPTTTTNEANYKLWKVEGMTQLEFDLAAKDGNRKADIDPVEPLEFDTEYAVRLDTPLKEDGGGYPLWRAMVSTFRTELPPGEVVGRIVSSSDSTPVKDIRIIISDQRRKTNESGGFRFESIPKGSYRVEVEESYLYNGTVIPSVDVEKGEIRDLSEIEIDPKDWGSLEVFVKSGEKPLEGAWVQLEDEKIYQGEFILYTNSSGNVLFPRVPTGSVFANIGADHHNTRMDIVQVSAGKRSYMNITLSEDELPVTVEAVDANPDGSVDPQSDLLIHVPEPIVFSSLNVTLWELDESGDRAGKIDLTPPGEQDELTYVVDPLITLPMETFFELVIGDGLLTSSGSVQLLWKELSFVFRTPDYALSYINGSLLFEGGAIEDYEVSFGTFIGMTSSLGSFNITIDLSGPSLTAELTANGSYYGYETYEMEMEVRPGMVYQAGDIDLDLLPGWFSIIPQDGDDSVEPDTEIQMTFMKPIMAPSGDNWTRSISLVPDGSSVPVTGVYSADGGNTSVTFVPYEELDTGTLYHVRISTSLLREDGIPMFPLGRTTTFTTRPPEIIIELVDPDAGELGSFPLDGSLRLSLSHTVNKTRFVQALDFEPDENGIKVQWLTSSEILLYPYLGAQASYGLTIGTGIYGLQGQPLLEPFTLEITTTSSYSKVHELGSVQSIPSYETGWEPGAAVNISGTAIGSEGWIVKLALIKDGESVLTKEVTVDDDGFWSIGFTAPMEEGDYTIRVQVGIPGGIPADTWEQDVRIGEPGGTASPDGDDNTLMIAAIIVIVIVVLAAILGIVYARNQRKKAMAQIESIEYTEVEGEWEDGEE
ncbi:MAG: Ig-like domain-containing protein [Thermoplasmatota archaeon]